jgi:transposase-like protein
MAHLTVTCQDTTIVIRSQAFCGEFKNTEENQKALFVFLRLLSCPETGKPLFTYQELADAFQKKDRRDIHNFVREFWKRGGDFLQYLARKRAKKDRLFPVIERQVLAAPLLTLAEHYRVFCEGYPQEQICEQSFRSYVNEITVTKILKRVRQLGFKHEPSLDIRRYLQELLALDALSQAKKKEIVEVFPEVEAALSKSQSKNAEGLASADMPPKLLVVLLYVCNVSQEMLSLLFGVGKTSIHNSIYEVCCGELEWQILGQIVRWSGQVSVDEKWVKIKSQWYFVLCAVDSVSGFPLLMDLYPTLDTVSWTLFFRRFHALYGVPKLLQCDGSQVLAAAREAGFPGVRYQLCTFHKLKNLIKRLRQNIQDPKLFRRSVRFAKHIFANASVSSRKHAAKTLQKLAGEPVSSYIDDHILNCWQHLTLSLTNTAAERFNRKIEKCFAGRDGIPSVESAHVLLRGLWLKELLLNGHKHMAARSELRSIDVSRMCQEHLDPNKILHFFHDYDPSHVEKLA